jgi:hypothetical protein
MSTLKVNNLNNLTGTGVIESAVPVYAAGSVVQVKYFQSDAISDVSHTSSQYVLLDDYAVNITPKKTNSIIKLEFVSCFELVPDDNAWDGVWGFHRGTTRLGASSAGDRLCGIVPSSQSYVSTDQSTTLESVSVLYYDSPNTTSTLTYKPSFIGKYTGSININHTANDTDATNCERGMTIFSATEIAQ